MNQSEGGQGKVEGREIDALIAEHVMGYVINGSHWPGPGFWLTDRPYGQFGHGNHVNAPKVIGSLHDSKNKGADKPDLWSPTTQIETAMQVVEKIGGYFQLRKIGDPSWQAAFGLEPTAIWKTAESAPLAICLSALASARGEGEGNV